MFDIQITEITTKNKEQQVFLYDLIEQSSWQMRQIFPFFSIKLESLQPEKYHKNIFKFVSHDLLWEQTL